MENITLMSLDQRIKDFLAMPAGPLKNLKYRNTMLTPGYDASIVYKDGCMYYGCTIYKVSKSKHSYFLKAGSKDGFTLDAKGKLQIWYGRTVKKLPFIDDVIKAIGNDWYINDYLPFLTKGVLEKILNRKITNPLGFFEAWLKAQHIKASPRLVFKAVSQQNPFTVYSMMLKYQSIFKHMDQFLEVLLDYQGKRNESSIFSSNFIDMLDQAVILEQTVDPYWSGKRIEAEHQRMTQEIMELELDDIENTPIEGLHEIKKLLDGNQHITLLDNRRAVFMEGKMMSHCIYTNYWHKIETRSLLCFHVDYRNQKGTLTLQLDRIPNTQTVEYRMYEFKDKYNREPGEHVTEYVNQFINQFNVWLVENKITVPKPSDKYSYVEENVIPF